MGLEVVHRLLESEACIAKRIAHASIHLMLWLLLHHHLLHHELLLVHHCVRHPSHHVELHIVGRHHGGRLCSHEAAKVRNKLRL